MMKRVQKSFLEMNASELAEATKEYDSEYVGTPGKALTVAQRRQHERAKSKVGRPVIGKGHKVISTSLELGLLRRTDALAKRRRVNRATLIAEGLRLILNKAS
jgi:hypothetical protein